VVDGGDEVYVEVGVDAAGDTSRLGCHRGHLCPSRSLGQGRRGAS